MSIKKNYGFNLLNSLLNIVFPIVTFPYAARILSPEGIGEAQFIFSLAQYFAILAAFGIPIYGVKAIAEVKHNKELLSKVTTELLVILSMLVAVVLGVYSLVIINIPDLNANWPAHAIAGSIIFLTVFNVDWFFSGTEQFKILALRSAFVKGLSLIILFTFVKTQQDTLEYLFFLVFLYIGNYFLNFLFLFRSIKISFAKIEVSRHFKPLLPIFAMIVATTIYTTLDTVMLGFLNDEKEVGFYTSAVKLAKVSIPVLTSMGVVMIPRATKYAQEKNMAGQLSLYGKSFSFLVLLAIPMSFGIFLLNKEAILIFSGPLFLEAVSDVRILAFLPLLIGLGHLISFQILIPHNKNRSIFYATLIGMFVFLILSITLIPSMGSTGAAIANTATELIVTIGYCIFVPSHILKALPWKAIYKALVSVVLFIPIVFSLQELLKGNPILIFSLSIITCGTSYFLIQHLLFKEELIKEIMITMKKKIYGS